MDVLWALQAFQDNPSLESITLAQLTVFIRLASCLKEDILLPQPVEQTTNNPPEVLPPSVALFLSKAIGIPLDGVSIVWDHLKPHVLQTEVPPGLATDEDEFIMFQRFGWHLGLSMLSRLPSFIDLMDTEKCCSHYTHPAITAPTRTVPQQHR